MNEIKKTILIKLTILLYVIAMLHIMALYFFWYWSIWWLDILMHFLGGMWVGGMAFVFLFLNKNDVSMGKIFRPCLLSFVVVLVIGVLWEIFEFSLDTFIIFQPNDISDTISDLGADIAGGMFACLCIIYKLRQMCRRAISHG